MSALADTKLFFLKDDCLAEFGEAKGNSIYSLAEVIYLELCTNADYKNNDAIRNHLTMNLFPTMAYYKALRKADYDEVDALALAKKETTRAAGIKKADQAKIVRMPCAYLMYRMCVKSVMKKNFPNDGWEIEWIRCDEKEIHFNMKRCIYKDLCDINGCPELCWLYCENDDIAFSGLMPKIRFERSGTLGKGSECCDFHFIKNKQ